MVVTARRIATLTAGLVAVLMSTGHGQQGAAVRASVDTDTIRVGVPFWLKIEVTGEMTGVPRLPAVDGIEFDRLNRSMTQMSSPSGKVSEYRFQSTATKPGPITIPAIRALVDGAYHESAPLHLNVQGRQVGATLAAQTGPSKARAWVDQKTVFVNQTFYINIEGRGEQVSIPAITNVEGLRINPRDVRQSSSFTLGSSGAMQRTEKRSYGAVALRPGTFTVPEIDVIVDGQVYSTPPFEITAVEPSPASQPQRGGELTIEDAVLLRMETDKTEVYQGEPILLSMQLWRIDYPNVTAGSHRGANITSPSTEGFYTVELEPMTYSATNGPWDYIVTEQRQLLYPTGTGDLTIGSWHWEGVVRYPSQRRISLLFRDEAAITRDAEPVVISVKPLPNRPPNFSGAVGQFELRAAISNSVVAQGVPTTLAITVTGSGNPDAIGDPRLPEMPWAHVSDPERETDKHIASADAQLVVTKTFRFVITPHEQGQFDVGPVIFTYFDPKREEYVIQEAGPFTLNVMPSDESEPNVVVSRDIQRDDDEVDIVTEDIRPIETDPGTLRVERPSPAVVGTLVLAPVLVFLAALVFAVQRRRAHADSAGIRSRRACDRALKRLAAAQSAPDPLDELYRTVTAFVADRFDIPEAGLTSADVDAHLAARQFDPQSRERLVNILRRCERARYASHTLTPDESRALTKGAEVAVMQVDAAAKGTHP